MCFLEGMPSASSPRVAVTGYGCVTALGRDASSSWIPLIEGRSARAPITAIPVDGCRVTEGAQATLPELGDYSPKRLSRLSRADRLVIPAVQEALAMAGLLDQQGISSLSLLESSISTTACGMEKGERFLESVWGKKKQGRRGLLAHYQAQQQIGEIHKRFCFSGPSTIIANACAGGSNAIGHAFDLIHCGMADVILTGGYDALCELVYCGFDSLLTLAPETCRPFDKGRNGLMLGEGAAFLVLESEAHAVNRGVAIQGIIAGYGQTTDTGHLTQPDQQGLPIEKAMRQALDRAAMSPSKIGYVNAHGTGTPFNDGAEAKAIKRLFSGTTARLSSTKAALGHTLGAAGAIEAVIGLMALKSGFLPPQINLQDPEDDVAEFLVAHGEKSKLEAVISINLGFGGSNAALVIARE
jgi:3-oxoacyl-[acyl-carrier-protein] synthase II